MEKVGDEFGAVVQGDMAQDTMLGEDVEKKICANCGDMIVL